MTSTSGIGTTVDHAAVRPVAQHRRRRAGRAAGDQRRQRAVADGPAESADLPQDQPGRPAGADLSPSIPTACRSIASTITPTRSWRRSCRPCRACPKRGSSARSPMRCTCRSTPARWPLAASASRTSAPRSRRRRIDQPKGDLEGAHQSLYPRHQRPAVQRRRLQQRHRRLSQRRAGARQGCRPGDRTRCRTTASAHGTANTPAEGLAIQRQAGANTIQLVDTIKAMMPAPGGVDPALGQGRPGVRPLADDPRRGA